MADITLADYAGYIFREMIRARETADAYSRAVAEAYSKDDIMRHFSVPRFKVPTMQLTIPVLVSGARFAQTVRFTMTQEAFINFISGQVREVTGAVRASSEELFRPRPRVERPDIRPDVRTDPSPETPPVTRPETRPGVGRPIIAEPRRPPVVIGRAAGPFGRAPEAPIARAPEETVEALANDFWGQLRANPDPARPSNIVQDMWTRIFERALADQNLVDHYKRTDPENKLLQKSTAEVLQTVNNNTAVDSSDIKSLLVNPETQVVKSGSSDASVFVIKVDMTEEGFYIRDVKDDDTGQVRPVVEFE